MPKVSRLNSAFSNPAFLNTSIIVSALRECLDGLGEITVGALVFADEFAIHRQYGVAVDAEQLLHRETDRRGEFYDAEMSSLLQYSAHFAAVPGPGSGSC